MEDDLDFLDEDFDENDFDEDSNILEEDWMFV